MVRADESRNISTTCPALREQKALPVVRKLASSRYDTTSNISYVSSP